METVITLIGLIIFIFALVMVYAMLHLVGYLDRAEDEETQRMMQRSEEGKTDEKAGEIKED